MSLRQQLLKHLKQEGGVRECIHCGLKYSANSDSTAIKSHLNSRHPQIINELLAQHASTNTPRVAAAAAPASSPFSDVDSVGPSQSLSSSSSRSATASAIAASRQPSISVALAAQSSKSFLASLARFFVSSSIAHRVTDTLEFREFLQAAGWRGDPPSRVAINLKNSILAQADALRAQLLQRISHTPIAITTDGWTNVSHQKVTNVILLSNGVAYYWSSIVNSGERNDAQWLAAQFQPLLHTLTRTHKLRITAFVADNEAVNFAAYKRLRVAFPFLVHIPCAAHTLQLIVRNALSSPHFSSTITQLHALLTFFEPKEARHELRREQMTSSGEILVLLKPCDTRWSSTLHAIDRVLRIKPALQKCFDEDALPAIADKRAFFVALVEVQAFLKPFAVATDAIQSDHATLFTVYQQFVTLLTHVRTVNQNWAATLILTRWERNTNCPATVAVALLSLKFATLPAALDEQAAQDFLIDFGARYSIYYDSSADEQSARDMLLLQFADFKGREGVYADIDEKRAAILRAGGHFNPRGCSTLHCWPRLQSHCCQFLPAKPQSNARSARKPQFTPKLATDCTALLWKPRCF